MSHVNFYVRVHLSGKGCVFVSCRYGFSGEGLVGGIGLGNGGSVGWRLFVFLSRLNRMEWKAEWASVCARRRARKTEGKMELARLLE